MSSDPEPPRVSIVVPTRGRPGYLEVALASIAPQSARAGAELIVVDDAGPSERIRALSERHGARYEPHPRPLGLNVARNTGVERSSGELVAFVDDDVEASRGWLEALVGAAREHPEVDVFAGRVLARLEGSPPRSCGREGPPVTALDLGPHDRATRFAWGSNMAIRRAALERVGPFDVSLENGGDEQEWQERLDGKQALYVAGAELAHRRDAQDSRLRSLCAAAYARGRAARRFDERRAAAPTRARELGTLAGCLAHVVRRRCPAGLTMAAHSGGRLREALRGAIPLRAAPRARGAGVFKPSRTRGAGVLGASVFKSSRARGAGVLKSPRARGAGVFAKNPNAPPSAEAAPLSAEAHAPQEIHAPAPERPGRSEGAPRSDDFLSGESGTIGGLDALRRRMLDAGMDALELATGRRARLDRAARREPARLRVLALCVERAAYRAQAQAMRAEIAKSRHAVELHSRAPQGRGKFENLNLLLADHPPDGCDWLVVLDDDIALPSGFLDRFLFLAERFALDLAQPAHRLASHAGWSVTRRVRGSVARETRFVEIGPVTALRHTTFQALLPFPELRMGWGLDMHWAAVADERGWRRGVIDATPIAHRAAPAADAYSREEAIDEARAFLRHRPHLSASEAQQTLATHRRW
jgi:GT2 family glycosyltransferase